jgi:enoyl-CoA hydratase
MTFKTLLLEQFDPGIQVVKINRPQALNALNSEVLAEMREALGRCAQDDSVRVVVLTGEGEKSFIAGADISEMASKNKAEGVEFSKLGHEVTKILELMPKPTLAAVNGFALGGGCEFALACDFTIASANAVFAQPEVGLGVIPGFGGTVRLIKAVGIGTAKDLIFTGRKVKADEALRIGLCSQVLPAENFLPAVIEVAKKISVQSSSAIASAKKLLNEFGETLGLNSKLDAEAQEFGELFGTKDQREGMLAFTEKRKAKFQGLGV